MSKTALIVDDSRLAQIVLKKMLLAEHLHVDCRSSAEAAFDYLGEHQPDIIFLDHTMPGMNGLEALQQLKANTSTRDIPVFMYTSEEDKTYSDRALALGASEVLPKQLPASRLRKALLTIGSPPAATNPSLAEKNEGHTLEQIVYDAEEALKHETWQQRFRLAFEQHRDDTRAQLNAINQYLHQLRLQQSEAPHKRQLLWNRLLGLSLFVVTFAVFFSIYLEQNRQINELQQQILLGQTATPRQARVQNPTVNAAPAPNDKAPILASTGNGADYEELAAVFNSEALIPFGDNLLGNKALLLFEELDQVLSADGFTGAVVVNPADSQFCIEQDNQGQTRLAAAQTPITNCRFNRLPAPLTSNISIEVQRFIDERNRSGAGYYYRITEASLADIGSLLNIKETTTAAEWNNAAAMNRRLIFSFEPGTP